ncbi:MAG: FG-GAP-like repeat-containing protein [Gemmataceae bacterium]
MQKRTARLFNGFTILEDRLTPALTIQLDYTYDNPANGGSGFFSDPQKKAVLQQAANDLASHIQSTPAAIIPGGINSWTATFFNPSNGTQTSVPNLTIPTGTILIYVGAMALGSNEAGQGGTGGYSSSGTQSFLNTVRTRGMPSFSSWGGALSFDTTVSWYTGSSPSIPHGMTDLYTVATHEMGHVLGFGTSAQFTQYTTGAYFVGPNAETANQNRPIALSYDLAHWAQGTTSNGQPTSMQPELLPTVRYGFSSLDYAALQDLGWQVSSTPTSPPAASSTITSVVNPTSPTANQAFTINATVNRTTSGAPSGTLTFLVSGLTVGTVPLNSNGQASITVPGTGAGTYPITVNYSGDSTTQSTSSTTYVTVKAGTTASTPVNANQLISVSGLPDGSAQTYRFTSTGSLNVNSPSFQPFSGFMGTVRSVTGDFNGDGVADTAYVIGAGGGSQVRVIDGKTGTDLAPQTSVFEGTYTGGLFIAAADFNGDGKSEIIVSPDQGGGGRITVLKIQNGVMNVAANFFGIDDTSFRGGARIATADVNGDGSPDLIVGAGYGGGPRVAIFDGKAVMGATTTPARLVSDFFAFGGSDVSSLRNGIYVAAGDLNGDGKAELIFGGGPGGGPRVMVVSGAQLMQNSAAAVSQPLANFFAFDATQRGGVRVAVKDVGGDGKLDLVVGSGQGTQAEVKIFGGNSLLTPVTDVNLFNSQSLLDGIYVG